jgi:hypothetical protein
MSYYQQAQYTQNTAKPVRCSEVQTDISRDYESSGGSINGSSIRGRGARTRG